MRTTRAKLFSSLATASIIVGATAITFAQSSRKATSREITPTAHQPSVAAPIADQAVPPPYHVSEDGRVLMFVEMEGTPGAVLFAERSRRYFDSTRFVMRGSQMDLQREAELRAASEANAESHALDQAQQRLQSELENTFGAEVLYRVSMAHNGIAVRIFPDQIERIADMSEVKSITPIPLHAPEAVTSVPFIGTRALWGATPTPYRGEGVGVAVQDTGIDFVHKNFGGPGGTGYATGATTIGGTSPATMFPTSKVIWGYDFVGDAYNGTNTAAPDPNPMDTNGHGTGCASITSGFGTNADGNTYTGGYTGTTPDIAPMRISPGVAPASSLYALKIFGTSGSTGFVPQGADVAAAVRIWQLGPEGAPYPPALANLNPQPAQVPRTPVLSVVNHSVGSRDGFFGANDPSAVAVGNATNSGLTWANSAGNNYDIFYVTGSPGIATQTISNAASYNDKQPGAVATAPANGSQPALNQPMLVGTAASGVSSASPSLPATPAIYANPPLADQCVVGDCSTLDSQLTVSLRDPNGVFINNADGSPNPAANNVYAGKVVLLDRGVTGFHQKALAASKANAAAAVIVNNRPGGPPGMGATAGMPVLTIPVVSVSQPDGALMTNTGVANTPPARPGLQFAIFPENPAGADIIVDYSSRGPRRGDNRPKPDITAPAENVTIASATSGDGVGSFNGTSSASPHTAGSAALLRQLTNSAGVAPAFSMEEVKAVLMNSVRNNPRSGGTDPNSPLYGVGRAGIGRLTLNPQNGIPTALAMSTDPDAAVSVSFGVVNQPANATGTYDRDVRVVNKTSAARTFSMSFTAMSTVPGVSYSFPDGGTVVVPANGSVVTRVRMTAIGAQMRHRREDTVSPVQTFAINTPPAVLPTLLPRHYLAEPTGYITFSEQGGAGQAMRLSVYANARPVSALTVTPTALTLPQGQAQQVYSFAGNNINTGPNNNTLTNQNADIISHAKAFELQYQKPTSTETNPIARRAEVRFAGVTSDFNIRTNPYDTAATNNQSAVVVFAIVTHAEWQTPSAVDTDARVEIAFGDTEPAVGATPAWTVRSFAWNDPTYGTGVSTSNMYLSVTNPGTSTTLTSTGYYTGILPERSPNLLNNTVITLPVNLQRLGITAASATSTPRFWWRVRAFTPGANPTQVTLTPWMLYDVSRPGVDTSVSGGVQEPYLVNVLAPGQTMPVNVNTANFQNNRSLGMLVVFPHNEGGARAQAILPASPVPNRLFVTSFSPTSGPAGTTVTITGSGFTGTTSVRFRDTPAVFMVNNDSTITATVPPAAASGAISVVTPFGTATSTTRFIVTP